MSGIATAYVNYTSSQDANKANTKAANNNIALEREMWETSREDLAPYRDAGVNALGQMQNFQMPNLSAENFQASPDYQFRLDQGLDAVNKNAGAGLMRNSGRTLKALNDYGQQAASQEYSNWYGREMGQNQDQWNRYAQMAGMGGSATSQAVGANQNAANAIGQQYTNIGNSNAAAAMAPSNMLNSYMNMGATAAGAYLSDERAKEDIEDTPLGLEFVNTLRPVRYKYKGEEVVHDGFLAQQVKEALESAGVESEMHAVGEHGIQGIRYHEMISPLIKAVQELSAKVEALEAK